MSDILALRARSALIAREQGPMLERADHPGDDGSACAMR